MITRMLQELGSRSLLGLTSSSRRLSSSAAQVTTDWENQSHACVLLQKWLSGDVSQPHVRTAVNGEDAPAAGQPLPHTHPWHLKAGELAPGVQAAEFAARRASLAARMGQGDVAIIASSPPTYMAGVIPYPYRQSPDFLYLTGVNQVGPPRIYVAFTGVVRVFSLVYAAVVSAARGLPGSFSRLEQSHQRMSLSPPRRAAASR